MHMLELEVQKYTKKGNYELKRKNSSKTIYYFKLAYDIAKNIKNEILLRSCTFNLGSAYLATGKNNEGLAYLINAIPPNNMRDGFSNGNLYSNLAICYQQLNQLHNCSQYLKMALEEYKYENNNIQMAKIATHLAQLLENQNGGDWSAQYYYEIAAKTYQQLADHENFILLQCSQAHCLVRSDHIENAILLLDECMINCKTVKNLKVQLEMINDIGITFVACKNFNKAREAFQTALHLPYDQNNDYQLAVIFQNLGGVYNALKDWDNAIKCHNKSIELYGLKADSVPVYYNFAFALAQEGRFKEAIEAYSEGLRFSMKFGDTRSQWQCLEGLGIIKFTEMQLDDAVSHFQLALALCNNDSIAQEQLILRLTKAIELKNQSDCEFEDEDDQIGLNISPINNKHELPPAMLERLRQKIDEDSGSIQSAQSNSLDFHLKSLNSSSSSSSSSSTKDANQLMSNYRKFLSHKEEEEVNSWINDVITVSNNNESDLQKLDHTYTSVFGIPKTASLSGTYEKPVSPPHSSLKGENVLPVSASLNWKDQNVHQDFVDYGTGVYSTITTSGMLANKDEVPPPLPPRNIGSINPLEAPPLPLHRRNIGSISPIEVSPPLPPRNF